MSGKRKIRELNAIAAKCGYTEAVVSDTGVDLAYLVQVGIGDRADQADRHLDAVEIHQVSCDEEAPAFPS